MPAVKTLEELAEATKLSPGILAKLGEMGCPLMGAKGFLVNKTKNWVSDNREVVDKIQEADSKAQEEGSEDKASREAREALTKQRMVRYRLDKLKFLKMRGDLVALSEIQKRDVARIQVVKRSLLSLARSLPPILQGMSIQEMESTLRKRVMDLMKRFAGM